MIPRMRAHRVAPLVGLLLALSPAVCASEAQSGASGSRPEAVVDSFIRATEQAHWRDAARLMDLESFAAMREQAVRFARRPQAKVHRMTAEEMMKADPKMPRVVAEYEASRSNAQIDSFNWLAYEYADVPSVDSLAALSAEDVAARWLEAKDARYRMRRALEAQRSRCNLPDSVFTKLIEMPPMTHRILGTVMADSIAYVLYEKSRPFRAEPDSAGQSARRRRPVSRETYVSPPPVMTVRRVGIDWRIAPSFPFDEVGVMMAECKDTRAGTSTAH